MKISIKQIASMSTTVLTAIGVLYMALSNIWGLPFGKEVTDTTVALAAAIATILGLHTSYQVVDVNKNGIPDDQEIKIEGETK